MGFVGADVEELRSLAAQLEGGARELGGLSRQLGASIDAAQSWQGPDAERCKQEWGSLALVEMAAVADDLSAVGRELEMHALEQEVASADTQAAPPGQQWWRNGITGMVRGVHGIVDTAIGFLGLRGFFDALKHPSRGFGALSRYEKLRDALRGVIGTGPGNLASKVLSAVSLPITIFNSLDTLYWGSSYEGLRGGLDTAMAVVGGAGATVLGVGGVVMAVTGTALFSAPIAAGAAVAVTAYGIWGAGNYVYDNRAAIADFGVRTYEGARDAVTGAYEGARDAVSGAYEGARDSVTGAYDSAIGWARGLFAPAPAPAPGV